MSKVLHLKLDDGQTTSSGQTRQTLAFLENTDSINIHGVGAGLDMDLDPSMDWIGSGKIAPCPILS